MVHHCCDWCIVRNFLGGTHDIRRTINLVQHNVLDDHYVQSHQTERTIMYGIVRYISGAGNQAVKPSGVTWFGSEELAKQYYGWHRDSEQFPIGEWGTDDYGREVMVDVLTRTEILGSDFAIEGKLQLQYGAELEKDPEQSGVTVRSIAS